MFQADRTLISKVKASIGLGESGIRLSIMVKMGKRRVKAKCDDNLDLLNCSKITKIIKYY